MNKKIFELLNDTRIEFDESAKGLSAKEKAAIIKRLEAEEEMLLRKKQQADPAAQRKLLIKVIVFVVVLAVAIGGIFVAGHIKDKRNLHHRAEEITEVMDE